MMSDITKLLIAQHGVCNDGVWRHVINDYDDTMCIVKVDLRRAIIAQTVYVRIIIQKHTATIRKYCACCDASKFAEVLTDNADLIMQLTAFAISDGSYKLPVDIASALHMHKIKDRITLYN